MRDSRALMASVGLTGVLAAAKTLILWHFHVPQSPVSLWVYFWQDVAVASTFGALVAVVRRAIVTWLLYAAVVVYIAINVPVAVELGSPMTVTMWRAAGGALSDSVAHDVTAANIARLAGILGMGAALPYWVRRVSRVWPWASVAALVIAAGVVFTPRIDAAGFDRNAITALLPHVAGSLAASADAIDPHELARARASGLDGTIGTDLTPYRGAARGWNVLLIVLESTAAQYLATYGAPDDPMPTLTTIARESIVFDAAYAAYPESVKGLYATLCGRLPVFGAPAELHATLPCAAVADAFAERGYRTGLFHSGRFRYLGMDALVARLGFDTREDAGTIGGNVESSFGVDEPATVDRVLRWIDSGRADRPFFAAYLPIAGHHPYAVTAPGPFGDDSDRDRYKNALHEADAAVGRLVAGLRSRGLDRRTMLVLAGDHGEAFGQHRANAGHTLFVYEENVHVPLVIALPGLTARETRVATPASLIDVGATLRELAALPASRDDQGTSLLEPGSRIAPFFTDYSLGWLGLRDGCWKYLFEMDGNRPHLYEVCRDPAERTDLAPSEPARVNRYRAWWARIRTRS